MEKELEVARTIQETLVPNNDTVDRQFIKLAGYFQPASVRRRLVDLPRPGGRQGAGGHRRRHRPRRASAMITAAAKAACDVARAVNNDDVSCTQLLEIMNKAIFESGQAQVRDDLLRVDPGSRDAHHHLRQRATTSPTSSAPPTARASSAARDPRQPPGRSAESKHAAKTQELPGDLLVWYTDGIVECENDKGEEYGEKRFRASIGAPPTSSPRRSASRWSGPRRSLRIVRARTTSPWSLPGSTRPGTLK